MIFAHFPKDIIKSDHKTDSIAPVSQSISRTSYPSHQPNNHQRRNIRLLSIHDIDAQPSDILYILG